MGKGEHVCACEEPLWEQGADEEDVAVKVQAFGENLSSPIETAALSVWVDHEWFVSHGGRLTPHTGTANSVDGSPLQVGGKGRLSFSFWGLRFEEEVRVMSNLPDKLLLGRKFWRRHSLILDLDANEGSVKVREQRHHGPIGCGGIRRVTEAVNKVIEDVDIDHVLKHDIDYAAFSEESGKQHKLGKLLWKHQDIFKGLGKITGVKHQIELEKGAKPVCAPLRRRSPREEEMEREAMWKLLNIGVLEQAVSPWAANNVFVRKKDGRIRVISDFRALNAATVTDTYPMEDVRNTLDWLAGKKDFSTFDLKDGFFQVELDASSKPLTAIRTVLGLLQYTRLPMGMKNSTSTFQRVINTILGGRKGKDLLAFMDDMSLGTEDEDSHIVALESLLRCLHQNDVRLSLSKCQFGVRSAEILGHRVDKDGVQPSAAHVEAIKALTEPATGDELMRFLGLVNFFAAFIDHFAETASPLYAVLKGTGFSRKRKHGEKFIVVYWHQRWGEEQRRPWRELKKSLCDPEILAAPVRRAPKRVMTDASAYGLGGVLLQQAQGGEWRPVSFTIKLMKKAERHYTPTEKECLAIVHALKKWRHYLHGEHFTAVTDHLALKWLMSLKDPRERLARWVIEVQDYDFAVEHREGKQLVVPDALSRDAMPKPLCQRCYRPLTD